MLLVEALSETASIRKINEPLSFLDVSRFATLWAAVVECPAPPCSSGTNLSTGICSPWKLVFGSTRKMNPPLGRLASGRLDIVWTAVPGISMTLLDNAEAWILERFGKSVVVWDVGLPTLRNPKLWQGTLAKEGSFSS